MQVYVTSYGMIFRISKRGWIQYCKAIAVGLEPTIEKFGGTCIGQIEANISDFSKDDALQILERN